MHFVRVFRSYWSPSLAMGRKHTHCMQAIQKLSMTTGVHGIRFCSNGAITAHVLRVRISCPTSFLSCPAVLLHYFTADQAGALSAPVSTTAAPSSPASSSTVISVPRSRWSYAPTSAAAGHPPVAHSLAQTAHATPQQAPAPGLLLRRPEKGSAPQAARRHPAHMAAAAAASIRPSCSSGLPAVNSPAWRQQVHLQHTRACLCGRKAACRVAAAAAQLCTR